MGYISKGIALCGNKQVRDAHKAFDLASTFANGESKTIYFLFLVKARRMFIQYSMPHYSCQAVAFFNANQHGDAIRRIRELSATCPNPDIILACRIMEVCMMH